MSKVTDNGDYYFSISGSKSDGFTIRWFRKIGWDSVTSEFKQKDISLEELIEFLSNEENHIRKSVEAK